MATSDAAKAAKLREKYQAEANSYRDQQKDIDAEARKLEQETKLERRRADRYDLAEVFLEIGLVVTSITLLSGRRIFWKAGMVLGVVGVVVTATAPLVGRSNTSAIWRIKSLTREDTEEEHPGCPRAKQLRSTLENRFHANHPGL